MMEDDFYIYLTNKGATFIQNTNVDFTTQLSDNIHLEGDWECALAQFQFFQTPSFPVFVCCDLIRESRVGDHRFPVLRQIRLKTTEFADVEYHTVKIRDFNTIRIYVRRWSGMYKPSGTGPSTGQTYCTLHFRKRNQS